MPSDPGPMLTIDKRDQLWAAEFTCMASPCEILIEIEDGQKARALLELGYREAIRIETHFSRYRDDNIVHRINLADGPVRVDAETARLLDFASECYQISEGLFDITSGVFRRLWRYAADSRPPAQSQIDRLLPKVGWHRVRWQNPVFELPAGMEIDFGGIGKEYAVDTVAALLSRESGCSLMVNFGGDCHATRPRDNGLAWMTGIENPLRPGDASAVIPLRQGAVATSGDVYKFISHRGKRYGHILNPKTGWPRLDSPLSVTVAAATCTEAGVLSTLAMLQGRDAESFLRKQQVKFWCIRDPDDPARPDHG